MSRPTRERLNFTLDPDVVALLRLIRPGSASAWVEAAIRERWQRWRTALESLQLVGYSHARIVRECDHFRATGSVLPESRDVPEVLTLAREVAAGNLELLGLLERRAAE